MAKSELPYLRLSVHGLVDYLLRAGDIDDRVYNQETMEQGSLLHSSYQKKQKDNYLAEYPLSEVFSRKMGTIALQGRADGIILEEGKPPVVDELKSTVMDLDEFYEQQKEWHLGQALCYALMYAHEKKLDAMGVRLTYISQTDSKKKAVHDFEYTLAELEEKVHGYVDEYLELYQIQFNHQKERDASVESLPFPYEDFRPGQRELAKYAYSTAMKGGVFFAEAPTGIGKTISTIYPFVKTLKRGRNEKLFYLTAKTTGAKVAYEAITDLREKGLVCHDSYLLSRDKICFLPGHACNPDDCPFAKNYYGKLKQALLETAKSGKRFSHSTIVEVCMEKQLCPFEFQLDLSLYADIVICDYNYFFDPFVYLERYFSDTVDTSRYLVLIDEAHNLVDRGRMMYSSSLSSGDAFFAKRSLPKGVGYTSLKKAIGKVESALLGLLKIDEKRKDFEKMPEEVLDAIDSLRTASIRFKKTVGGSLTKEAKEFFREANRIGRLSEEHFGANFRVYAVEEMKESVRLNLYCLDASSFLKEEISRVRAAALFSATFSPMDYFQKAIFGKEDYPYLLLPSPFPKENFKLIIAPKVSVRYKDREKTYAEIAAYLEAFVKGKKGNYFLYFPSYEYLKNIRSLLTFEGCSIHMQDRSMSPEDREAFLENFPANPQNTNIGLLILGGAFSEGIDLVDDRLIGVGIVGIGLPMVCEENNMIREYADSKGEDGFSVAYKNPGINKVMQAVGRLIRSETDIGAALLIDDRYARNEYRRLFSRVWEEYDLVTSPEEIKGILDEFYASCGKPD